MLGKGEVGGIEETDELWNLTLFLKINGFI